MLLLLLLHLLILPGLTQTAPTPPNVVLIVSDDLRAQVNVADFFANDSGLPRTSNLESLAKSGHSFNHAYANQALCGPSRNSFLSGRRPQRTEAYNFVDSFRDVEGGENWTTLPGLFKRNNYTTVGAGKIFHPGLPPDNDMPYSWDDRMSDGTWESWMYPTEDACPLKTSWCGTDNETDLEDFKTTQQAIKLLDNITSTEKNSPFFLAVGYRKPHLQWRVPNRILENVPLESVSSPASPDFPPSTPPLAYHMPVDDFLLKFSDVEQCGSANLTDPATAWFSESCSRLWRRGYYSAVEYMDEQVGIILNELKERKLEDNTIVIFFGDHGWHLGEFGMFEKFSNFEVALRTPMFIRAPSLVTPGGLTTAPVELVDVYRTVADLANLQIPANESSSIDGESLLPLMQGMKDDEVRMAFSQFPRCLDGKNYADLPLSSDDRNVWNVYNDGDKPSRRHEITNLPEWKLSNCNEITVEGMDWMGLSVRTQDWRYTVWHQFGSEGINWEAAIGGEELYSYYPGDVDIFRSPNNFENVAGDPVNADVVNELRGYIEIQWNK
ncbi:hypothetical protein TrVE_jg4338 [Triparma verrucosa]|uniref:Sulfatase N-terminal domain-containing protein n=1 Tax=Triparma verrucosa TaxID=1606542 RepID=A0A9W7KYG2_9STRA|nr:hypothetical protein TrVE_jg4338 [Triparma verrucosa]